MEKEEELFDFGSDYNVDLESEILFALCGGAERLDELFKKESSNEISKLNFIYVCNEILKIDELENILGFLRESANLNLSTPSADLIEILRKFLSQKRQEILGNYHDDLVKGLIDLQTPVKKGAKPVKVNYTSGGEEPNK